MAWGPIPARTGQPVAATRLFWMMRAYPRSHGATGLALARLRCGWGLSPLARGNQVPTVKTRCIAGPIPARTGQPPVEPPSEPMPGAYPRSHGATAPMPGDPHAVQGLSPLARGNQALTGTLLLL